MNSQEATQPTDDRGRAVTLQALDLPKKPSKRLRKLSGEISLGNSQNMHWSAFFAFLLIAIGPGLILVVIQAVSSQPVLPDWYWHVVMLAIGLFIACAYRWVPFVANARARETNRRAIHAWAQAGLCPACGHDLALDLHKNDVPQDDDGMATCPECGAQWRAARFEAAINTHAGDWRRQWQESQRAGTTT
ncbi:MAG: hypothetical protein RIE32_11065 [Phycisphaerales bacterium]